MTELTALQTDQLASKLVETLSTLRERSGYSSFTGSGDSQAANHLAGQLSEHALFRGVCPDDAKAMVAGWLTGAALCDLADAEMEVETLLEGFES